LLGNGRAKTAANESPQFHYGRFANSSIDHSPCSQTHRATMQLSIEQILDLRYRQIRIVTINRKLIPCRARRGVRDKADLIGR
jgi:hypothetical protein